MIYTPKYVYCQENNSIYHFEESSTETPNETTVLLPENGLGRWILKVSFDGSVAVTQSYVEEKMSEVLEAAKEYTNEIIPSFEQQQSDFGETDPQSSAFIRNKPEIPSLDGFVRDSNYVHTDNNFSQAAVTKLSGIEELADVNVIEGIKFNGINLSPDNLKIVDINIPEPVKGDDGEDGTKWHLTENDIIE
jgi:hypothetical protein